MRLVGALLTLYHAPPKMHARQLPDISVVKAARCQRARGHNGVLRLRKVDLFHRFKTASAPCPLIVLYGCVCPWRLALQKEGWRQQMDEIRAVRTPQTGPEEGKASKMAAPFLGPGCCIHSQPPSACSE